MRAAVLLPIALAALSAAGDTATVATSTFRYGYPSGALAVALCGEGGTAHITFTPNGANASFLRYQGYINQSALATAQTFAVTKSAGHTILARQGWSLNVSHADPLVALSIGGVVVSRDLSPPTRAVGGAACDPPKWAGLPCVSDPANGRNCRSGIGMTVATDKGGCLRGARSLASANVSGAAMGVGISDEHIFGFGQTVTPGLDAVGSTKFIATFSRTLATGPSHAPAPSYISLATDAAANQSVAHGFFLNTHGYSAFDLGAAVPGQLGISSPDPIMDYFLFAGPVATLKLRRVLPSPHAPAHPPTPGALTVRAHTCTRTRTPQSYWQFAVGLFAFFWPATASLRAERGFAARGGGRGQGRGRGRGGAPLTCCRSLLCVSPCLCVSVHLCICASVHLCACTSVRLCACVSAGRLPPR